MATNDGGDGGGEYEKPSTAAAMTRNRDKYEMHFTTSARREAKAARWLGTLATGFTLTEAYLCRSAPELFGVPPMWALPLGVGMGLGLLGSSYAVGNGEPFRGHTAATGELRCVWFCSVGVRGRARARAAARAQGADSALPFSSTLSLSLPLQC